MYVYNRTVMKKLYVALLLFAVNLAVGIEARAQWSIIMQHRDWVEKTYANPEEADEETLLRESAMIICSNLQEDAAFTYLERTAGIVPEIEPFIQAHRERRGASLSKEIVPAVEAIAVYAEKNYPKSLAAVDCRRQYFNVAGFLGYQKEAMSKFIKDQEKWLGKDPGKERLGIYYATRLANLLIYLNGLNYEDPAAYPEVFRLEKEVLKLYPVDSDEISMIRADLYSTLGTLKCGLNNDFIAFSEQNHYGQIPEMEYIIIGVDKTYPCNSLQYYTLAADIASKALNPGHPAVHDIRTGLFNFRLNALAPDENTLTEYNELYNYIKYYYPADSFEMQLNIVQRSLLNKSMGLDDPESLFAFDAFDYLENELGTANPNFLLPLANMARMNLFSNPDDEEWLYYHETKAEEAGYGPDSEYIDFYTLQLYGLLPDVMNLEDRKEIDSIAERYLRDHHPTLQSVAIARELGNFYGGQHSNDTKSREIFSIAISDIEKMAPEYALLKWDLKLDLAAIETLNSHGNGETVYPALLEELERDKTPAKEGVKFFILRNWAAAKNLNYDYEGCALLMKQCAETVPGAREKVLYSIGEQALATQKAGLEDPELAQRIDVELELIDRIMADGYKGQFNYSDIDCIGEYLFGEGRIDEAVKVKQHQLEIYRQQYVDPSSYTYISLLNSLAMAYESADRLNEAARLRDQVAEILDDKFTAVASENMLSCLWDDYYAGDPRNPANLMQTMQKLQKIIGHTLQLCELSDNSGQFIHTFMAQGMAELFYAYNTYFGNTPRMDERPVGVTEEQQINYNNIYDNNRREYDIYFANALNLLESFKEFDPGYHANPYYQNLASAVAAGYGNVLNDTVKAMEIRVDLLDGIINPSMRFTNTIGVAMDFLNIGDREKSKIYLAKAEALMPSVKNIETLDNLNLNFLQFVHAMNDEEYEKAAVYARERFSIQRGVLDGNFQLMTTKEQNEYLNRNGDPAFTLTTVLEYLPGQLSGEVYDALVYRTGMQLRSQRATREAIQQSNDPKVALMLDSLNTLNRTISQIDISATLSDPEDYQFRLNKYLGLQRKINRLEQSLLDATKHLREGTIADVRWEQVRDLLAPDQAAIEFLFSDIHVMALVIRNQSERPEAVMLMPNDQLWETLNPEGVKGSGALARELYSGKRSNLYEGLWEPIEQHLEGVREIFFSAPGVLSSLAFHAFPTPDGETLFDKYELVQLTTTAQLAFDHEQTTPATIAMMGDILYSPSQKPLSPANPGNREVDADFSLIYDDEAPADGERALVKSYFPHLPFTAIELEGVRTLFKKGNVESETRLEATETRLHEMIERKPDVLHLATHGYYVSANSELVNNPFFRKKGSSSMQRSGIALAGAEMTWRGKTEEPDETDGIVTAAEVAEFDLKHTQLVTLSACETALGDTSFEGVFGLQRGFKQAGVQSLLVSLWSVNDNSTALFMTAFYQRLIGGNSRQQAWREAIKEVRLSYPDPYFWAPFIMLDGI